MKTNSHSHKKITFRCKAQAPKKKSSVNRCNISSSNKKENLNDNCLDDWSEIKKFLGFEKENQSKLCNEYVTEGTNDVLMTWEKSNNHPYVQTAYVPSMETSMMSFYKENVQKTGSNRLEDYYSTKRPKLF